MPDNQVQTTTTDSDIRQSTFNIRQPMTDNQVQTTTTDSDIRQSTVNTRQPMPDNQEPTTTPDNQQSALENRQSEAIDKQLSLTDTPVKTNIQQRIRATKIKRIVNFDGNLRKINKLELDTDKPTKPLLSTNRQLTMSIDRFVILADSVQICLYLFCIFQYVESKGSQLHRHSLL
jgi:hypothetical protein